MTYDIPASGRFFCYILPLLLALCAVSLNACGEPDMNRIAPQFAPQPVGVVGAPQQAAANTDPPDNHKSQLNEYFSSISLQGSGSVTQQWTTVGVRAYWKQPTPVTVQSRITPLVDTALLVVNEFTWGTVILQILYGDGNADYVIEVPAGQDVQLVATYCQVYAKITVGNGYVSDPTWTTPISVPKTVQSTVGVSLIGTSLSGDEGSDRNQNYRWSNNPSEYNPTNVWELGPFILSTITGYHEASTDLYLMLFDSGSAVDYSGSGGPTMAIADGAVPLYQFKIPSGENFSVNVDPGFVFQHDLWAIFSTTPSVLTATDPNEYNGEPSAGAGVAFAMNFNGRPLNPLKLHQGP